MSKIPYNKQKYQITTLKTSHNKFNSSTAFLFLGQFIRDRKTRFYKCFTNKVCFKLVVQSGGIRLNDTWFEKKKGVSFDSDGFCVGRILTRVDINQMVFKYAWFWSGGFWLRWILIQVDFDRVDFDQMDFDRVDFDRVDFEPGGF